MSELRGLGAVHRELQQRGGRLIAISVDPPEVAKRVVTQHRLPFDVLCDTELAVTRDYGLTHAGGGPNGTDVPIPTHLLISPQRQIVWRRSAALIQDRPSPELLLTEIRSRS
jgi:peroxiredoxin